MSTVTKTITTVTKTTVSTTMFDVCGKVQKNGKICERKNCKIHNKPITTIPSSTTPPIPNMYIPVTTPSINLLPGFYSFGYVSGRDVKLKF
jgi:hypothetical protein